MDTAIAALFAFSIAKAANTHNSFLRHVASDQAKNPQIKGPRGRRGGDSCARSAQLCL